MFQPVSADWQLSSRLVVHKPCVLRHTGMSIVEDVENLMWEVQKSPPFLKNVKAYSDRNMKDKLWYEFCESVFTNWSDLLAEKKSEKVC